MSPPAVALAPVPSRKTMRLLAASSSATSSPAASVGLAGAPGPVEQRQRAGNVGRARGERVGDLDPGRAVLPGVR